MCYRIRNPQVWTRNQTNIRDCFTTKLAPAKHVLHITLLLPTYPTSRQGQMKSSLRVYGPERRQEDPIQCISLGKSRFTVRKCLWKSTQGLEPTIQPVLDCLYTKSDLFKMMFSKAALATAAMMASSTVFASINRCGTPSMTPEQVNWFTSLAAQSMGRFSALKASFQKDQLADVQERVIKVYVHVLANGTKVEDGYLDESQIHEQISVLNADFGSAKFSFALQNISYTIDKSWADGLEEYAFKSQLRRGDYSDLNLYFPVTLPDSLLGYSHFPVSLSGDRQDSTNPKDEFLLDGVVIRSDTLPFGSYAPYNLGRTATHETGHWFGLDHTFGAGGCDGKGDMIADTPMEASPAYGCPVGRDSCPDQEGLDPIHNFMDYSDDGCMEEFTPLQRAYMHSAFETYRQNVAKPN